MKLLAVFSIILAFLKSSYDDLKWLQLYTRIDMKFALVDGQRLEAQSHLSGVCIGCGNEVVAKCGTVRINHWAHKSTPRCDPWWENETKWHRDWKNLFPSDWQEVVHFAESGEKHIADVKTDQGWIIEFQHSYLTPGERLSRDSFYRKLVWVVDGNRRLRDKKSFMKALEGTASYRPWPELHLTFPEGALFRDWIESTSDVFVDFGEDILWWVFPESDDISGYVLPVTRAWFIQVFRDQSLEAQSEYVDFTQRLKAYLSRRHRFP